MNKQLDIRSIEQAEKLVSALKAPEEKERSLYQCIESIFDKPQSEISGSADSFHNFAISCIKVADDYLTAYEIVELGLALHPNNTDLLADAIKYGYYCGKREQCEEYLSALYAIDIKLWTWRAFSFVIDYMLECYTSDDKAIHSEEELKSIVRQYQEKYPNLEDSYFSEFEIYNRLGEKQMALDVLRQAIEKIDNCPKCWLRYADEMVDLGKFEEAVKPIMKLYNSSNASDSINISYVYYLKGLCQMELLVEHTDDIFADSQYDVKKVEQTYLSFYNALNSSDIYENVRKKCWYRIDELYAKTGVIIPYFIQEKRDID